jgi:RHS repeat-associated protein
VSERFLSSSSSREYHSGPQGETRQLSDSTGERVDTYLYTAYGVPMTSTGADRNPFRYGGQFGYYTDPAEPCGIVLCGARWYNPYTARWMTRDPIGYEGGDNLYAYCEQDPIGAVDAQGLLPNLRPGARAAWEAVVRIGIPMGSFIVRHPHPQPAVQLPDAHTVMVAAERIGEADSDIQIGYSKCKLGSRWMSAPGVVTAGFVWDPRRRRWVDPRGVRSIDKVFDQTPIALSRDLGEAAGK